MVKEHFLIRPLTRVTARLVVSILTLMVAARSAQASVYTAETLARAALNGQDGWLVTGFGSFGVQMGTGIDATNVISNTISTGGAAARNNDANFNFGSFTGLETRVVLQLDVFGSSFTTALFGLGRDSVTDTDTVISQASEIGPQFGVDVASFEILEAASGTTHRSIMKITTGAWYRLQLVVDFTANLGSGAGSLSFMNLSAGESVFSPVPDLQNVSLGLTATAPDVRPATYNGMRLVLGNAAVDNFGVVPEPAVATFFSLSLGAFALTKCTKRWRRA